jgi:hypothetical protein
LFRRHVISARYSVKPRGKVGGFRGISPIRGKNNGLAISLYNNPRLDFRFYPLRFHFIANEPLFFPPGKAANILRGALGVIFRRIGCVPHCADAKTCDLRDSCPYARVFEPVASGHGPSGLADWPRPFVFRARHLEGRGLSPGESFWFDLHVFSLDHNVLAYFVLTFASLAREGLGPRRGKAELQRVASGTQTFYEGSAQTISGTVQPLSLNLTPGTDPVTHLTVEFLTPTELKHEHKIAGSPEFPILFGRIRDRIATLSRLYGGAELDIDYLGTNERAGKIVMTNCRVRHEESARRSTRTGQSHSIGGFVGTAEYKGDLTEFLPWLAAAPWVGVGRQCVWGKGELRIAG